MKHRKLIALAGAAIIASSMPLLSGAPAALAAADPAVAPIPFSFTIPGECTVTGTLAEDRDSNGAYTDVHLLTDPCGIGVEAGIWPPGGTPCWGGDVHNPGQDSSSCHVPVNSGNRHGYRNWNDIINNWVPDWNF